MMFEYAEESRRLTDIRVAGVGGAGGNAVDRMVRSGLTGVEFLVLNTDLQALGDSQAHQTLQIGAELTHGLGSGGNPRVGEGAAEEDRETIREALEGANMVFVTAGMGGGTGTGAAPVVAEIARQQGALTVGIVTKPFLFEGNIRKKQAEDGIRRLRDEVDTLIVVPNQRLLEIVPPSTSMDEAFLIADQVLYEATRGIYEIISRHDTLNLDFADVCSVMRGMGVALMGTGRASGEGRALKAAQAAIQSPLLENLDIQGSKAVLVNVLGGQVGLHDTAEAMSFIQEAAGPDAHVIFGYGQDESLGDTLQVTVIATGFQAEETAGGSLATAADPVRVIAESQAAAKPVTDAARTPQTLELETPDKSETPKTSEIPEIPEPEALSAPEVASEPEISAREPELSLGMPDSFMPDDPIEPEMVSVLDEEEPELEPEPEMKTEPEPEPETEPELETMASPEPESVPEPEPAREAAPEPSFLEKAAAAGGPEKTSAAASPPPSAGDAIAHFHCCRPGAGETG